MPGPPPRKPGERLPQARSRTPSVVSNLPTRAFTNVCSCSTGNSVMSSQLRETPIHPLSVHAPSSAAVGFPRTRYGTFPPAPGCARSTSATRNHEDLDPCSRLSILGLSREARASWIWDTGGLFTLQSENEDPGVSRRPRSLRRDRFARPGLFARGPLHDRHRDTPSPRRLRTRPFQGHSRKPPRSRPRCAPLREETTSADDPGCLRSVRARASLLAEGTAPRLGDAATRTYLVPRWPAGWRISRPFASGTAGEGVCFEASSGALRRLVLEGRCDASDPAPRLR